MTDLTEDVTQEVTLNKRKYLPNKTTLVEVRPIERKKWHGKNGAESFQRAKKFQVLVDPASMTYATGLNEDEIVELSKKVNYDLSNNFNSEEQHPFWDSPMGMFKLENYTMFFDIMQPLNYIKIKNMLASKYVANSMKEYEEGLFPEATHVIFDEALAAEEEASKVELKDRAVVAKVAMTKDRKIEIILAIDHKNLKGQSDNFVNVALDKLIQRDAQAFLHYADMNNEQLALYALVLEALQKSVLRKDGHKILYHESQIGTDEMDVARYLHNPENQDLKLRLMAQVN